MIFKFRRRLNSYVFNTYNAGLLSTKWRDAAAILRGVKIVGNEAVAGFYVVKNCSTHWNQQIICSENCAREEECHGESSNSQSNVKSVAG